MTEINIDAENHITGRVASFAAKKALLGDTVKIFNCEKAVISGSKEFIQGKYGHARTYRGQIRKGPYMYRDPDRFFRRIVRGMLPHDKARGREAFRRVLCYIGIPEEFKGKKLEKVAKADAAKLPSLKSIKVGDLCKWLGAKL